MKYQNKGDNDWQVTSNNYACWHSNVFFFHLCFIVPIMHHFWKYRTGVTVQMFLWPGQLNRAVHACLSACVSVLFVVLLRPVLVLYFCVLSSCTRQRGT